MDAVAGMGESQISVDLLSDEAKYQRVAITDSGKGFNADVLPKLFTLLPPPKMLG